MDTLFSNITAVTMADKLPVILGAYVGVTDGKISYISTQPPQETARRVIDGRGMVLMPGLINCHAHLPMTPLRGYGDDNNLADWLNNYIFPKEDLWDDRAIRAATLLGLAECLRFGTTSVSDMYYFSDTICQCVDQVGIKGNISRSITVFDEDYCFDKHPGSQEAAAWAEKWDGYDNGRIRMEMSIHAEDVYKRQVIDHPGREGGHALGEQHIHIVVFVVGGYGLGAVADGGDGIAAQGGGDHNHIAVFLLAVAP